MLELLTCCRGHFWEQPDQGADDGRMCPECGAPAESLPLLDLAPGPPLPPVSPPSAPAVPDLFDRTGKPIILGYDILEDLGRSAVGVRLYRAKQALVNRPVLLEVVVAREDSSQQAWGSLRGSASALGKLSHPNIIRIHEAGERDRQVFYNAVELVDGPTLAQKVADKPLPFSQVLRLMGLLARAIDHAHQQGVVHRHLEPSCILLQPITLDAKSPEAVAPTGATCMLYSRGWIPRITGFGLGRRPIEGDPTDVDLFGDQPGYLSPEQAWGRPKEIGPTTDVYGLGGILYFLLTGKPPFRGPSLPDILDAIQTADLVPPSDLRSVPQDLDVICRKCLARQPRRRYATAGALADDLKRAELSLPLVGRWTSNTHRFGKWVRRHATLNCLVVVGFLGMLGTLIGYFAGQGEGERPDLAMMRHELASARDQATRVQARMGHYHSREVLRAYQQNLVEAMEELRRNKAEQAREILLRCDEGNRCLEWHYLHERTLGRGHTILKGDQGITDVAFHPSEDHSLAVASTVGLARKGMVRLWDVRTGQEAQKLSDFFGPVHALCFTPNGQGLLTAGTDGIDTNGQVRQWVVADGPNRGVQLWATDLPGKRATGLGVTPSTGTVTVASGGGTLTLLSMNTGDVVWPTFSPPKWFAPGQTTTRVRSSADGRHLLSFTGGGTEARLWDARTVQLERSLFQAGKVQDAAISHLQVAVARSDNTVQLHNLSGGREEAGIGPLPKPVRRLAFSADGRRLAGACEDGTIRVWAFTAGGIAVQLLVLDGNGDGGLAFSPSGKALAAGGAQDVTVWGAR
jgi:serine/threonine protein kinase